MQPTDQNSSTNSDQAVLTGDEGSAQLRLQEIPQIDESSCSSYDYLVEERCPSPSTKEESSGHCQYVRQEPRKKLEKDKVAFKDLKFQKQQCSDGKDIHVECQVSAFKQIILIRHVHVR